MSNKKHLNLPIQSTSDVSKTWFWMSLFNANYCPQGVTFKSAGSLVGFSTMTAAFIPTLPAISNSQLCSRNPVSAHLRLSLIYIVVDTDDRSSYPLSISLYSQKAFPISVPSFIPHCNHLSPINPNQQVWESLCTGMLKSWVGMRSLLHN